MHIDHEIPTARTQGLKHAEENKKRMRNATDTENLGRGVERFSSNQSVFPVQEIHSITTHIVHGYSVLRRLILACHVQHLTVVV